jgi:hypothetical protein
MLVVELPWFIPRFKMAAMRPAWLGQSQKRAMDIMHP